MTRLVARARQQNAIRVDLVGDRRVGACLQPARAGKIPGYPIGAAWQTDQVIAPAQADLIQFQSLTGELRCRDFQCVRGTHVRPTLQEPVRYGVGIEMREVRPDAVRHKTSGTGTAHQAGAAACRVPGVAMPRASSTGSGSRRMGRHRLRLRSLARGRHRHEAPRRPMERQQTNEWIAQGHRDARRDPDEASRVRR